MFTVALPREGNFVTCVEEGVFVTYAIYPGIDDAVSIPMSGAASFKNDFLNGIGAFRFICDRVDDMSLCAEILKPFAFFIQGNAGEEDVNFTRLIPNRRTIPNDVIFFTRELNDAPKRSEAAGERGRRFFSQGIAGCREHRSSQYCNEGVSYKAGKSHKNKPILRARKRL